MGFCRFFRVICYGIFLRLFLKEWSVLFGVNGEFGGDLLRERNWGLI